MHRSTHQDPLRIVSVPAGHPYVRHLSPDDGPDLEAARHHPGKPAIVRLPDLVPAGAPPGRWWPPVALDASYIRANADRFDLLHVHFGTESSSLEHLRDVVVALREVDRPLVYTVHDLSNPQLVDQAPHLAQVELLVGAADGLITLTPGAADEIERRFGRRPVVVPHPNIFPLDELAPIGTTSSAFVVGLHLRDLRPNIDAERATATLLDAVARLRSRGVDVVARVDLNHSVRDEAARERVRALVADAPFATLHEHDRLDDEALAASLADLDVAVLPYRHGTHSGWVELCFDLGVAVVGPRVGFAGEQHPEAFHSFEAGDPASLAEALAAGLQSGERPGSGARRTLVETRRDVRRAERSRVAAAHDDVYAAALARPRKLRIAVIAPLRYPISRPHAGGLESSLWNQVPALRARGHDVVLCATEGSDFLEQSPPEFVLPRVEWSRPDEATDTTYPDGYLDRAFAALDRAFDYLRLHADEFDVIDNHNLHGLPLGWAATVGIPMLSTLHTPVLPAMLDAHRSNRGRQSSFVAVSSHTAAEWQAVGIESQVVPNAVDVDRWALGPGGDDLVWFGRIVPEKGVHLALQAARLTGRRLVIAGRIGDADYFARSVEPYLGRYADYVGPLGPDDLADLVGRSACALVTPVWQEPFGLVIAEALATGTPVASFRTGGVPEVVGDSRGAALVPLRDVTALARAADGLASAVADEPDLRRAIRADAVARFSLERRAADLEAIYRGLMADFAGASASGRAAASAGAAVDAGATDPAGRPGPAETVRA